MPVAAPLPFFLVGDGLGVPPTAPGLGNSKLGSADGPELAAGFVPPLPPTTQATSPTTAAKATPASRPRWKPVSRPRAPRSPAAGCGDGAGYRGAGGCGAP